MQKGRKPDRICRVGSREFLLYREYDEFAQRQIINYPDFIEHPEYTADGRPYTLALRDDCEHFVLATQEDEPYIECRACKWYRGSEEPQGFIGICLCEALQQNHG